LLDSLHQLDLEFDVEFKYWIKSKSLN